MRKIKFDIILQFNCIFQFDTIRIIHYKFLFKKFAQRSMKILSWPTAKRVYSLNAYITCEP